MCGPTWHSSFWIICEDPLTNPESIQEWDLVHKRNMCVYISAFFVRNMPDGKKMGPSFDLEEGLNTAGHQKQHTLTYTHIDHSSLTAFSWSQRKIINVKNKSLNCKFLKKWPDFKLNRVGNITLDSNFSFFFYYILTYSS